jgi:hypothetical protein
MTPDMRVLFFALAATIAGNIVAALVIWRFMEWRKTRNWRMLIAPVGIGLWVAAGAYLALTSTQIADRTFGMMIAGGILGALLSARALFGIVRYTKAETALGDDPPYKGSLRDAFAVIVVLLPVAAAMFLF